MHRETDSHLAETVRDRLRVVYIMGYGRSGSTVLDTILGNHPSVESTGELAHLVRAAWLGDDFCACGARGADCRFWSQVRAQWQRDGADPGAYLALQRRVEGGRGAALRLWAGRRPAGGAFEEWAARTMDLLEAIRAVSGKSVLVDSSKTPGRALALSLLPGLDLFVLHLVRDAHGVAWSLAKPLERDQQAGVQSALAARSPARTALAWNLVNRASDRVLARLPENRRMRLRYEDYVSDLAASLAPLEDFVGGGLAGLARDVATGLPFEVGHTIAGNRLRMSGRIELRSDLEWRERLPRRDRARVKRYAGGLLKRYGYGE